jgi:hypothetical protein
MVNILYPVINNAIVCLADVQHVTKGSKGCIAEREHGEADGGGLGKIFGALRLDGDGQRHHVHGEEEDSG